MPYSKPLPVNRLLEDHTLLKTAEVMALTGKGYVDTVEFLQKYGRRVGKHYCISYKALCWATGKVLTWS